MASMLLFDHLYQKFTLKKESSSDLTLYKNKKLLLIFRTYGTINGLFTAKIETSFCLKQIIFGSFTRHSTCLI